MRDHRACDHSEHPGRLALSNVGPQRPGTANEQAICKGCKLQPNIPGASGGGNNAWPRLPRRNSFIVRRSRGQSVELDAVSLQDLLQRVFAPEDVEWRRPWQPYLNHCGSQFPNMLHWPHALPLQRLNSRCPQCDKDVVGTKT